MNVIARLEYELAYYDSAVHLFSHYTTRTHRFFFFLFITTKSDRLAGIRLSVYTSKSQIILSFILPDGFRFIHIPFGCKLKCQFLTQFPVDHLSYTVMSSLELFLMLLYYICLLLVLFHWGLSDSKSPQVSRTLLSILAVLNNVVVWMVSTRPPTSMSSSYCFKRTNYNWYDFHLHVP